MDAKQEQIDNEAARLPITRLLLCVHGIGQNLTGANIAGMLNLRRCCVLSTELTPWTAR